MIMAGYFRWILNNWVKLSQIALILSKKLLNIAIFVSKKYNFASFNSSVFYKNTKFMQTIKAFVSSIIIIFLFSVTTSAQNSFYYADSLMIATKGCAYDGPSPMSMRFRLDKDNTLRYIRARSFELLQLHLADAAYYYADADVFLSIGNFFDPQKRHAVLIYIADALVNRNNDYKVNVYLFELSGKNELTEVFFAKHLSGYYENVAVAIHDIDLDGQQELLVHTSEPEWYRNDRPMNEYYHVFEYKSNTLAMVKGFEDYPNPTYIAPNLFYTYSNCGCGGDCWHSWLYRQTPEGYEQQGLVENACTGIVKGYRLNGIKRIQIAESLMDNGTGSAKAFWGAFIERYKLE